MAYHRCSLVCGLFQRRRFFTLAAGMVVFTISHSANCQNVADVPTHSVDNDGASALVVKQPDYYQIVDSENHVGMAIKGTRVRELEKRADAALPVLSWSQIKILTGDLKGKTGWVSSKTLHPLSKEEIDKYASKQKNQGEPPAKQMSPVELHYLNNSGDATLIVTHPEYTAPADAAKHVGMAPQGTPVAILKKQQDAALAVLAWYNVRVLSGKLKGKVGWVTSNSVQVEPVSIKLILSAPNEPAASQSARLGRKAELSLPKCCELLDKVSIECQIDNKDLTPSSYGYEMRKKGEVDTSWKELDHGPQGTFEHIARGPGYFEVRAFAAFEGDQRAYTQIEPLEVQFTTRAKIVADPDVVAKMREAWKKTHDNFTQTKTRREYSFYILVDTMAGKYVFTELKEGAAAAPGIKPTVSSTPPPDVPLQGSSLGPGRYVVASMHTHTPLQGNTKERPFGPSTGAGEDVDIANTQQLPGFVYDFDPALLTADIKKRMAAITRQEVNRYFGKLSTINFAFDRNFNEIALGVLAQKEPALDLSPFGKAYPIGPERRPTPDGVQLIAPTK